MWFVILILCSIGWYTEKDGKEWGIPITFGMVLLFNNLIKVKTHLRQGFKKPKYWTLFVHHLVIGERQGGRSVKKEGRVRVIYCAFLLSSYVAWKRVKNKRIFLITQILNVNISGWSHVLRIYQWIPLK